MIFKVSIVCLFFLAQGIYGYGPATDGHGGERKWGGDFRVRFSANGEKDGYYSMPKNKQDPLLNYYVQVPNPGPYRDHLNLPTYCYPDDPRVCVLFDKNGVTAGIQMSFLKDELKRGVNGPFLYDYSKIGMFEQSSLFGKPAYTIRVFFANPTQLKTGGRKNTGETADGLWVHLDEGWIELDKHEPQSPNTGVMKNFVKQGCFPGMGQHYFYKLDERTQCSKLQNFFSLYEHGKLVAFGIGGFGKSHHTKRVWFENLGAGASAIVPRRPACEDDWAAKMGFITFHVYFVEQPWTISCPAVH